MTSLHLLVSLAFALPSSMEALSAREGVPVGPLRGVDLPGGARIERAMGQVAGHPVLDGGITLRLAPDGTVRDSTVRPFPVQVAPPPPVPEGEGLVAWRTVGGAFRLVRMVVTPGIHGQVRTLDPWTGQELESWPLASSYDAPAQVYAFAPSDGEMMDVTFYDIDEDNLTGEFVQAVGTDRRGENYSYIEPEDGAYFYDEDDYEFAGVMAYHHLSHVREVLLSVAPHLDLDTFAWAIVNYPEPNAACAHYGDELYFLFGDAYSGGGYTFADYTYEANVMYHEYGHYALDQVTEFEDYYYYNNVYFNSVQEGWADFTAAFTSGHPTIGEYVWSSMSYYQRNVEEDHVYPDDFSTRGDPHENGRVLSSMAWDLYQAIGTDFLEDWTQGLAYVDGSDEDMHLAVSGLLWADADLHGYAHSAAILREALQHGLEPTFERDDSDPTVETNAVSSLGEGPHTPVVLKANVQDDEDVVSWYWTLTSWPEGAQATIPNPFAKNAWLVPDGAGEYGLTLTAMDAEYGISTSSEVRVTVSPAGGGGCSTAPRGSATGTALLALLGLAGVAIRRQRR